MIRMYYVVYVAAVLLLGANASEDVKGLMEEWDKHMRAFVPDDMMSFTVDSLDDEVPISII